MLTSKFCREMKYCGVSGNKINAAKNIIGSGAKIFGTKKYGKYGTATKPTRMPMVTHSINSDASRPRILLQIVVDE